MFDSCVSWCVLFAIHMYIICLLDMMWCRVLVNLLVYISWLVSLQPVVSRVRIFISIPVLLSFVSVLLPNMWICLPNLSDLTLASDASLNFGFYSSHWMVLLHGRYRRQKVLILFCFQCVVLSCL